MNCPALSPLQLVLSKQTILTKKIFQNRENILILAISVISTKFASKRFRFLFLLSSSNFEVDDFPVFHRALEGREAHVGDVAERFYTTF
jgi:hypothetical protein